MNSEVQQYLQALADQNNGRLTPEDVVSHARSENSPLHSFFTWDDAEAATKQRLHEARELIRSVKVEVTLDKVTVHAPFFVRDPGRPAKEGGYISTPKLRSNEDLAREALVAAFNRVVSVLQGARELAAVLGMDKEVTALQKRVLLLTTKAEKQAAQK